MTIGAGRLTRLWWVCVRVSAAGGCAVAAGATRHLGLQILIRTGARRDCHLAQRRARRRPARRRPVTANIPWLFGGDADLGGSTKTIVPGGDYGPAGEGRNLRFGIREHAMGAIGHGMLYHGGIRPVRRHVLRVQRLPAAAGPARRAQQDAGDLRVDARLGRPGRGWPDPPAGRAPDVAARDGESVRVPAERRQRDRRRLAQRDAAPHGRPRSCCRARICRS